MALSAKRERLLFYLIVLVACVAALVALADAWSRLSQRFDYEHAWISAHFATSARAFASEGILPLHGVPIVNNPPFEMPPLAYLHWPPLYSMMLAWVFKVFGESETAGHAFMLLFLCINTVLIGGLAHALWGRVAAAGATLGWLSLPVVLTYSHLVWNLPPAISFLLVALIAFVHVSREDDAATRWTVVGCAAMSLAVCNSWEPAMACPGLLAAAFWSRQRAAKRAAVLYLGVTVATAALILINSAIWYPQQVAETVERVLFRMGLTKHVTLNAGLQLAGELARPGLRSAARFLLSQHFAWLGLIGLPALCWQIWIGWRGAATRDRSWYVAGPPVVALLSMWWLWTIIFWFHMYIHNCQFYIAAPPVALAIGWGISRAVTALATVNRRPWRALHSAAAVLCLVIVLFPVAGRARLQFSRSRADATAPGSAKALVEFGEEIRNSTPDGSVVVISEASAIPLFYSRRHLIQGVESDGALARIVERLPVLFPQCNFFLALTPGQEAAFAERLRRSHPVKQSAALTLIRLEP